MIKIALSVVLAISALSKPATAAELNALDKDSVLEITAGMELPHPIIGEIRSTSGSADPVVLTVPGLSFGELGYGALELKHFIKFFRGIFGKTINAADIVNGLVSLDKEYFFQESDEDLRDLIEENRNKRLPDDYLEAKLKELPEYQGHNLLVVPFSWSRDPGDTAATVPQLEKKIIESYEISSKSGRPLYILAHSWGSVLTHEALHRLEEYRPEVKVEKLITAGSPLVPANRIVKLFLKLERHKEHLQENVAKPSSVKIWRNIWASRDAYSNAIPAADYNYQVDSQVENVEPDLIDLILHDKNLKRDARRDLFKIRNIKDWHGSYFFDYSAELRSIHKEIVVKIFRPVLAPQVAGFDQEKISGL